MRTSWLITGAALGLGGLGRPAEAHGQATATAAACGLLPTADLEAHFGAKATAVRSSDTPTVSMCSMDLPDRRHGADLSSKPAGPVSLSVEQRLAALRPMLEQEGSRIQTFGTVGCFTGQLDLGGTKLPTTTCFLDQKGYLSLSLRSDKAKDLDFEAVKQLLEKAAGRRT